MVTIENIESSSPADKAGLKAGDRLISADSNTLRDALDVQFYIEGEKRVEIVFQRDGQEQSLILINDVLEPTGITPEPIGLRRCRNNCVFCFVDQQPAGLRDSLYIKDEDIRHSFLHGNYITLTDVPEWEYERIVRQRMSPIYVSVHSSDEDVRRKLLGRTDIPPILPILERLTSAGISVHTQIVVVPGFNDKLVLEQTIRDLYSLGENCFSCAVVPVGLTRYRADLTPIEPVGRELAESIVELSWRLRKSLERPEFLQLADEFFLLAEAEIPETGYYGDFPQLDNGVGMVRLTIEDALNSLDNRELRWEQRDLLVDIITGTRAAPILEKYFPDDLGLYGVKRRIVPVENRFWGEQVTAANLLTGSDITEIISGSTADVIFLPPKVANADSLLIDDVSLDDLKRSFQGIVLSGPTYLAEVQKAICSI